VSIGEEERAQPDPALVKETALVQTTAPVQDAALVQDTELAKDAELAKQAELARRHGKHMLSELQFRPERGGLDRGEVHGEAQVTPFMHVPGAPHLRTSVLAMWSDMLGGILSLTAMRPRVSVTLELDVHLYRPAPASGVVRAEGRTTKAGRSVHVAQVSFRDEAGEEFGFSTTTFMAAHDTSFTAPSTFTGPSTRTSMKIQRNLNRLSVPLAERARLRRGERGVAELPLSEDGLNSTDTMHGGLIALVAEESVLTLAEPGAMACSLQVRYLSPVRTGPAVATAAGRGGLYRCELRDSGNGNRLAALATVRTF
jgi:acyl-coenzyme A thioesterase PaaI-like protein